MCEIKHIDFYANDWISGTASLTLEERGFYITACALIYDHGGPVPRDRLKRACGVHGRTFNAILGRLLELGKLSEIDGKIGQKRAEKELKNARNRVEKWLKNLDNQVKSNGYDDRAGPPARGVHPPASQESKNLESSQPSLSPSPARAREAPPPPAPRPTPPPAAARPTEPRLAGLAGLSDFRIPDEWVVDAENERERLGLPKLDLRKEADKTQDHWRDHPPDKPHAAWLGRARIARPDGSNVIELQPRRSPEEIEAERQAAKLIARANMGIPVEAWA